MKKEEKFDGCEKNSRVIDSEKLYTYTKEIADMNIIEVEVGTTGYCGGDAGNGGRTYLRITDMASTYMACRVNGGERKEAEEIELLFEGDSEMLTFIEALEFSAEVLRSQMSGMHEMSAKEKKQEAFK